MRIAALVLAIVGALAALGVGLLFLFGIAVGESSMRRELELVRNPLLPPEIRQMMRERLSRTSALPYFLLAGVPLCALGAMFAMERRGISAGVLLLVTPIAPVALVISLIKDIPQGPGMVGDAGRMATAVLLVLIGIPAFFQLLAALFAFLTRPESAPVFES